MLRSKRCAIVIPNSVQPTSSLARQLFKIRTLLQHDVAWEDEHVKMSYILSSIVGIFYFAFCSGDYITL